MLHPSDDNAQSFDASTFASLSEFDGSLSQRTYLSLRDAILALRCKPGVFLRKSDICERLGVSRSPVSEAMSRLATEGLVEIVPQAGTSVARLSMADIHEGAFLREALELAAIEYLAPRITEEELRALRRNLRVQAAAAEDGDIEDFYRLDAAFHTLIHKFTGFTRLSQMAQTAWVNVDRARRLLLPMPGRVTDTLREHEMIFTALEAHDATTARQAMQTHLSKLVTLLAPLEQTHPDYFAQSSSP